MQENWVHARRSEDRRIAITGVNVLAASGSLVALALTNVTVRSLPLAVWLVAVGTYGSLACLKLNERADFHTLRARRFRARLAELTPIALVDQIQSETETAHLSRSPRLAALRFNSVLLGLNLVAGAIGVVYIVISATTRG